MEIERRNVEDLTNDPRNVRLHSERNVTAVCYSLDRYGQQKPIVVDATGKVIAGNGTLEAARRLGWQTIDTVRTQLVGDEATGYAIADNRTSELASWDLELLADELAELEDSHDLDALGFDASELADLGVEWKAEDFDDAPVPGPAKGDGWQLQDVPWCVHHGDSREVLQTLEAESVDAIVCDPPYELGFMGKAWDNQGIAYSVALWQQCLRVLKPGGHLLAFGGTRTSHRMVSAIEDAGFEVRDSLCWLYGSGFPKSLDVSKAIDAAAGAERPVVGFSQQQQQQRTPGVGTNAYGDYRGQSGDVTGAATPEAARWSGWGTALKPAHEPICLARKPLDGTVAANVQAHGAGALNIDAARVGVGDDKGQAYPPHRQTHTVGPLLEEHAPTDNSKGRWPANVVLDQVAAEQLDKQSGERPAGNVPAVTGSRAVYGGLEGHRDTPRSMGASRFFYVAKASTSEREAGLLQAARVAPTEVTGRKPGSAGQAHARAGMSGSRARANTHPTVKPVELMRWLVRLSVRPGGVVLDPFCGSGTTGIAARIEGVAFVGIEQDAKHVELARARIAQSDSEQAAE